MSCALITGVEGFTGRYLARELSLCGHSVAGIGINPCPVDLQLQQYKQVDLSDPSATAVAIAAMRPDLVFHLAGISHVQSSPDAIYRINVAATRNLLAALAALETPPGFTLLASTANLYGNSGGVLKETAVPDPQNDYAVSKLAMEYMANIWRDRLPITIVRPSITRGADRRHLSSFPNLFSTSVKNFPSLSWATLMLCANLVMFGMWLPFTFDLLR